MEKKRTLPLQWGSSKIVLPEDVPDWLEPYQQFLSKYGKLPWLSSIFTFNLEFAELLPERWPLVGVEIPGDTPGSDGVVHGRVVTPFTLRLSMRVRASLYFGQHHPGRGAQTLFECFAHLEAMQQRPFAWPVLWTRQRERMKAQAYARGKELFDCWVWNVGGQLTPAPVPAPPSAIRILVVDDLEMWRLLAKAYLEEHNCVVTLASSGYEAIQLAAQKDFDLILMDLNMPGMDGRQVTQALRELGCNVPILSITGEDSDHIEDIKVGIDGTMHKPWTPEGVEAMLQRWAPRK